MEFKNKYIKKYLKAKRRAKTHLIQKRYTPSFWYGLRKAKKKYKNYI